MNEFPEWLAHFLINPVYRISRNLVFIFLKGACGLKVSGQENIPKSGGFILAPNHTSYFDPPIAGSACLRLVRFIAKGELFENRLLGLWMKAVGCLIVKHGASDRHSLRLAIDLLKRGECVCVFPEGVRVAPGMVKEGEPGIAFLAQAAGVPVVPMAILGTQPWNRKIFGVIPWFSKMEARIGKPLHFELGSKSQDRKHALAEFVKQIMTKIHELKSGVP